MFYVIGTVGFGLWLVACAQDYSSGKSEDRRLACLFLNGSLQRRFHKSS